MLRKGCVRNVGMTRAGVGSMHEEAFLLLREKAANFNVAVLRHGQPSLFGMQHAALGCRHVSKTQELG